MVHPVWHEEEESSCQKAEEEGFNWLDPLCLQPFGAVGVGSGIDVDEQSSHQTSPDSKNNGGWNENEDVDCGCVFQMAEFDRSS